MPYIEREKGVRIHYNHYGHGFPLVFLHGFSANAWLWAYQAPVLAHKYQFLSLSFLLFLSNLIMILELPK